MTLGLDPTERVAVLGARGWFGQTLCSLLPDAVRVFRTASSPDEVHREWSVTALEEFAPTLLVNCAFLTREREKVEGMEKFHSVNTRLIEQFGATAQLPSVRAVVTISSGAAVTDPDTPYGSLKAVEERVAVDVMSPDRSSVVLRAYSVSGPYVRRPRDYAFSNFILQAPSGTIAIQAGHPVYRRYVSVSDALEVAVASAVGGWSGVIETGGELLEMGQLAERVVSVVNPAAVVTRSPSDSRPPETYASDATSWRQACDRLGFVSMDLDQQIEETSRGLLGESLDEWSQYD